MNNEDNIVRVLLKKNVLYFWETTKNYSWNERKNNINFLIHFRDTLNIWFKTVENLNKQTNIKSKKLGKKGTQNK